MIISWQIAILCNIALETVFATLQRSYATQYAHIPRLTLGIIYLFVVWPVGLAWFLATPHPAISLQPIHWLLTIAASVLYVLCNIFEYVANTKIDAGMLSLFYVLKPFTTIMLAGMFLHEVLQGRQAAGIVIILVAVITMIVVDQLHAKKHKSAKNDGRRQKYLLLGITAPILAGVATSLEKPALVAMTVMVYAAIGWGLQGLLLMISAQPEWKYLSQVNNPRIATQLLGMGLARGFASVTFVYSVVASNSAGAITTIAAAKIIAIPIIAYIVLKEKTHITVKVALGAMACVGVYLLMR